MVEDAWSRPSRAAWNEIVQRGMNTRDDVVPRAGGILPKQASGRIPGAVVPIEVPAPIGYEGQQYPNRFCQRTSEVSDAGFHRDHEVQIRDERRRVGETPQLIAEMKKVASIIQQHRVGRADILLQAYKCRIDIQQ